MRERFVWLLMLALHRSDRGNEALIVYAGHRARIAAELGAEPGPALRALHARLLAQDPGLMTLSTLRENDGRAQEGEAGKRRRGGKTEWGPASRPGPPRFPLPSGLPVPPRTPPRKSRRHV
ncbi:hypothetical protein G3I50_42880 [Streptomyces parvus]|uniref:Bacterial transcriptional activator domain-containing protein n=2 Tax=Streptomyces parvus TaxID=66428 RepID=A0A7K3SCB4_9ACTN|nr:hypothetical protein [Streptomyces parvus]